MNKKRGRGMRESRKRLKQEVNKVFSSQKIGLDFINSILAILNTRFKNISVRGFFVYAIYEYVLELSKLEKVKLNGLATNKGVFNTQIPFIVEIIMSIQYLENQILDCKCGIIDKNEANYQKINENVISSHYLKDSIYQYIEESVFPHDFESQALVRKATRRIFQFTDAGQFAEKQWSSFENFINGFREFPFLSMEIHQFIDHELINKMWDEFHQAGIDSSRESFARFYLQRMYLTSAGLFVLSTELVMDLLGYEGAERAKLLKFAGLYGILLQVVNDIIDYLPFTYGKSTNSKKTEDAYSDLRNNNLTLPFIFLYEEREEGFNYQTFTLDLENGEKQESILELLKPIFSERITPLLKRIAEMCGNELNEKNTWQEILKDFAYVINNEKYFKHFKMI